MLSSQVVVLALTSSVLGLVVDKRDYTTVYKDTQTLNTDATNLKNAVNKYDGSLITAFALNDVGNKFQTDLKTSNTDCSNSAAFTSTQALQELNYMNGSFEPSLKAALTAIKNKKATFTANGFKKNIQDDLDGFKSATDSFFACVKSKSPSSSQANIQTSINKIDADFADAINYYKS